VLSFSPPFVITEEQVEAALAVLAEVMASVASANGA
jgi:acetylornithine/succinyldiaminopimelate/putrescine aminotransferase